MEAISLSSAIAAFPNPLKEFDRWKNLNEDSKLFLFSPNPKFLDLVEVKGRVITYISSTVNKS